MTYAPSAIGGDFTHMLFADFAVALHLDPTPHLVGHNPQLLLTASLEADHISGMTKVIGAAASFFTEVTGIFERIYPHRIAVIDAENVTGELLARTGNIGGLVGVVINIDEPSGELRSPVFYDRIALGPRPLRSYRNDLMDFVAEPRKRQPDYLKHDPSKRHGRGRRKW